MADDIVERLRAAARSGDLSLGMSFDCMAVADEIERLRALCNDLYHDATCHKPFCRLCGEGTREWEATRG